MNKLALIITLEAICLIAIGVHFYTGSFPTAMIAVGCGILGVVLVVLISRMIPKIRKMKFSIPRTTEAVSKPEPFINSGEFGQVDDSDIEDTSEKDIIISGEPGLTFDRLKKMNMEDLAVTSGVNTIEKPRVEPSEGGVAEQRESIDVQDSCKDVKDTRQKHIETSLREIPFFLLKGDNVVALRNTSTLPSGRLTIRVNDGQDLYVDYRVIDRNRWEGLVQNTENLLTRVQIKVSALVSLVQKIGDSVPIEQLIKSLPDIIVGKVTEFSVGIESVKTGFNKQGIEECFGIQIESAELGTPIAQSA